MNGIWLNPKYHCNGCLAGKILSYYISNMNKLQRLLK
nr:MAG TPA_asm: hypothetical protein [Bacteriophage sp.]